MKYSKEVDILYITLHDIPIEKSDEAQPGVVLDYATDGQLVGIEIMNASRLIQPESMLKNSLTVAEMNEAGKVWLDHKGPYMSVAETIEHAKGVS